MLDFEGAATHADAHRLSVAPSELTGFPPRICRIFHADAWDLSSIHAASLKPLHPLTCTCTSSYARRCTDAAAHLHLHFVILTPLH